MLYLRPQTLGAVILALLAWSVSAAPPTDFSGKVARTFPESVLGQDPPGGVPANAPNVIVWVIDDLGFGQLGSYGGLIDTPTIDGLADNGLRFSNYHTTPICSSSRAALLTGRNSHTVHIGGHSALAINFPGQDGRIPRAAGTVANNLKAAGYLTYAIGKWDHMPPEDAGQAGPFTYWPSGQGFDRFYGFVSFDSDNFKPTLWNDHQPVTLAPDPDYHLTTDMADRAIEWMDMRDSVDKPRPFLLYWATGAVHAPHHAPQAYIERYRGKFDEGWDVAQANILARQKALGLVPEDTELPPRPKDMAPWDDLSAAQKKMYARAMEVFAAQMTHADEEFGRMLETLERRDELDNTIVIVTSDNGASAEGGPEGLYSEHLMSNGILPTTEDNLRHYDAWGGPDTYPHYPFGWAVAGNTPFRYYKQTAYEGGVHVPFIVQWPKGIDAAGEIRSQFHHVIDITPTVLELAGVALAERVNGEVQMPFDGSSMAASIGDGRAQTPHVSQYFEMYGNRAIWHRGWKAVVPHRLAAWDFMTPPAITDDHWELYDLSRDVNELDNLAAAEPARLAELKQAFDREAKKFQVYPLTNTGEAQRVRLQKDVSELMAREGIWRYSAPVSNIPEAAGPPMHTHSFTLKVDLGVGDQANGVVVARAGAHGGMALYLKDGVPHFSLRNLDMSQLQLAADKPLPSGEAVIEVKFTRKQPGASVQLLVDGKQVDTGESKARLPVWIMSNSDPFDVGSDSGSATSADYQPPFPFDGRINEVIVDVAE